MVTEWLVPQPGDPAAVIDPTSGRAVLSIAQPQANHNGGALTFGPDDRLYISLGDGGAGDDQGPGHSPQGNGQDPGNPLGAILRIDPDGADSANGQYGVPPENPFFPGGPGPFGGPNGCLDGLCDEIFAFGFRNPFRFSFDAATGDLYAADVGQHFVEEVDLVRRGGNYGWPVKEGSFCFDPNGTGAGFVTDNPDPACGPPEPRPDRSDRAIRSQRGHGDDRRLRLSWLQHPGAARPLHLRRPQPRPAVRPRAMGPPARGSGRIRRDH